MNYYIEQSTKHRLDSDGRPIIKREIIQFYIVDVVNAGRIGPFESFEKALAEMNKLINILGLDNN